MNYENWGSRDAESIRGQIEISLFLKVVMEARPILIMFTIELRMMFIFFEHLVQSSRNRGPFGVCSSNSMDNCGCWIWIGNCPI